MEIGRHCSEVFLDVSQVFAKVWHRGLLYKIKKRFSTDFYTIIRSYYIELLESLKYREKITQLKEINSDVLQGSILEPMLFTADLLVALGSTIATYVDDTVILAHN